MASRGLIATGAVSTILAAICCATPLLVIVLGAMGLSAWLAGADYLVIAVLAIGLALLGFGIYRRHVAATCCDTSAKAGDRT